jgi:poly(A) polymerase
LANDEQPGPEFAWTLQVIDQFDHPEFPLVLAALLHNRVDAAEAEKVCLRWRLSNRQTDRVIWLVENHLALEGVRNKPWSKSQKLLVSEGIDDLLALSEAECRVAGVETPDIDWCRSQLERSAQELNPPPLLTGTDLISHGVEPGPNYAILLQRVRDAQLDEEIDTRQEALALVDRILATPDGAEN